MTPGDFEPASYDYTPDDAASWSWNLKAELFVDGFVVKRC